jgi:hypothetical protein
MTFPLPAQSSQEANQDYAKGQTPVVATSGNVAAGSATAILAGVAGLTTYITGFSITGAGATGASVVTAVLSGLIGGISLAFNIAVPVGAAVGITPLVVNFAKPIPASAQNTAINLTLPSLGAGNTNACVSVWGFTAPN